MESDSSRLMAAVGCLALVWIGAYWLYEPGGRDAHALAPLPEELEPATLPAARTDRDLMPMPAPHRGGQGERTESTQGQGQDQGAKQNARTDPGAGTKPETKTTVIPPEFVEYTVKAGETYETIARARYGSAKFAIAISNSNPLKDPKRIRPGDVIRLPKDPGNIQGKPATETGNPPPQGAGGSEQGWTEYVVVSGDTLSGIAKQVWGSSRNWRKILDANASTLPSEDKLKTGMKLRIPPKPAD